MSQRESSATEQRRLRGKLTHLKRLLKDIRPGLAVYAKQTGDAWWKKKVAEVDRAVGNPPAFLPSTHHG